MFQTPTTVAWKTLFDEGRLNDEQAAFWKAKPAEELYDLTRDPDEVHNLASNPQFKDVLLRMRAEQGRHALEIRDVGFLSEDEIHVRSEGRTPYELGHDPKFPLERIIETANLASSLSSDATGELEKRIADEDAGVRYWAALGLRMRGASVVADHRTALRKSLEDPSPSVRIVAAEALARFGDDKDRSAAIDTLMKYVSCDDGTVYLALASLNALDGLEILPSSVREKLRDIPLSKARPAYGIERLKNSLTRNKNDAKSK